MPHDVNGREVRVGDLVHVPMRVKVVHAAVDFCNVTLETELGMPPEGSRSSLTLNTRQVELAGDAAAENRPVAPRTS